MGLDERAAAERMSAIDPEILLLDEGLGAGDAPFAERAMQRVDRLLERSRTLVLASHAEGLLRSMCNRALLLDGGRVPMFGEVADVIATYERLRSR